MTKSGTTHSIASEKSPRVLEPSQWVEAHGDALFGFAILRVRDREIAEDLVQDCLLGAYEARDRFTGQSAERTWLIGILKHKIIDFLRARSRRGEPQTLTEESVESPHFNNHGLWADHAGRWGQDPDALAQSLEFQATLADCIAALPDKLATTFVLREIDGMDSEEVCTILGITTTNMWARIHRARLSLRRCLERNWFNL